MEPEPPARRLHGALAACGALVGVAVFWAGAWLIFWIANAQAARWFERVGWLDVAFGAALVCAFAAVLGAIASRAGGVPAWTLVLAGAAMAIPVFGIVRLAPGLALALGVAAAAATIGEGRARATPGRTLEISSGLAIVAAFLVLAPALALRVYDDPTPAKPRPRFSLAPAEEKKAAPARRATRRRKAPAVPAKKAARAPDAATVLETPAPPPVVETPRVAAVPETPGAAAAPATPGAAATPDTPGAAASAERFMRAYYADLRRDDFAAAWARLAPAVRRSFGGFENWRDGFGTTVSQELAGVTATADAATATVGLTLNAADLDACGATVRRRFEQAWTLTRLGTDWQATGVRAQKVAGPSPCV